MKDDEALATLMCVMTTRRSSRAFLTDEVSREQLMQLLRIANLAPSARNRQPWRALVVTEQAHLRLRNALTNALEATPVVPTPGPIPSATSKAREDINASAMAPFLTRQGWTESALERESVRFYDAPAVIVLCVESGQGERILIDAGIWLEALCLAAEAAGLETCLLRVHPVVVAALKCELDIPETFDVVAAVALGHADIAAPVNAFHAGRVPFEENVKFYEQ